LHTKLREGENDFVKALAARQPVCEAS
jgi:hypothetical protein